MACGYRLLLASWSGGMAMELTPQHPECFVPQFTPDGKTIVFVRRDGDVYSVNVDGSNLRRLTEGNRYVEFKLSAQDRHGSTDGPHVSRWQTDRVRCHKGWCAECPCHESGRYGAEA